MHLPRFTHFTSLATNKLNNKRTVKQITKQDTDKSIE